MALIRNVSGQSRDVPWLGRVVDVDEVVDVPDADVYAYTQQDIWEPADDTAQDQHDLLDAVVADVNAGDVPPGNATREVWATYAVVSGKASEADVEHLTRDEIRHLYGKES